MSKIREIIGEKVATRLSGSGQEVQDTLVNSMAQAEINRRIDLASQAYKSLEKLEKDLSKVDRPDNKSYDTAGKEILTMSENRYKEIQGLKSKIENLEKTLESCINDSRAEDYKKLEELLKSVGNQQKQNNEGGNKGQSAEKTD